MRRRLAKPALALTSFMVTFLALEVGTRATKGEWRPENFLVGELSWFWAAFPTRYDPELGWAPQVGSYGLEGSWGAGVTVLDSGVRSNGSDPPASEGVGPVVAVGDSFTWGAEVGDHQTWPALLERRLGSPVINGGVFGFGVDQSYLRSLRLIEEFEPRILILSFIPDDVARCELSVRAGTSKSYFTGDQGRLELHPPAPASEAPRIGIFRRLTGYSFFLYKLLRRTVPQLYLSGGLDETAARGSGSRIVCELFARLAATTNRRDIELLVILQDGGPLDTGGRQADVTGPEECLAKLDWRFLNLRRELREMATQSPDRYASLFAEHMTPAGNDWVAQRVAETIRGGL